MGQRVLPQSIREPLQRTHKPFPELLVVMVGVSSSLIPEAFRMSCNQVLLEFSSACVGEKGNSYRVNVDLRWFLCFLGDGLGCLTGRFTCSAKPRRACILYLHVYEQYQRLCISMSDDIRFYKGKHKVKVLSQSREHWVVEALEPFDDFVDGKNVRVRAGERRIVAPNLLFKREGLAPPVKEHVYELKMEKKLKHVVEQEEKGREN